MNQKLKNNILNKSDKYNFYKKEYQNYKSLYQNLIKNISTHTNSQMIENISLSHKLKELKNEQGKIYDKYLDKNNITLIKTQPNNEINSKLKFNNIKLISENKFLIQIISKLQTENEILSTLNDKLILNSSSKNSNEITEYYKKDRDKYRNQYNLLLKKQKEYSLLINNILLENLFELSRKQLEYENIYNNIICKNMNIAYVLQGFPTLSETFVRNELKWLVQQGFNVKVFSYKDPAKPVDLDFELETIRFDGDLLTNLEKLLIEHEIDLIHTHFVYPTGTNITYPLAEKLGIPFTLFAHAYDIFIEANDKKNKVKEISESNYCKGIFTLSKYHKKYLMERGVPENKIILTRQATEYDITPITKKDNKKNNNIKNVVSISRFVEKKGIDTLIEAANFLKNDNFIFSIYGFGPLEKELKTKIKNLGVKNISIKGTLSSEEVVSVLKNSDLLVSPCRIAQNGDRDGIPTIIFESMAYGLPVLTTNVSAIPEVIKDNKNGFIIEPNNPLLLSNKIKEVMSLPNEQLFKIRLKAQEDVQNYSSIKNTMHTLLNTWFKDILI